MGGHALPVQSPPRGVSLVASCRSAWPAGMAEPCLRLGGGWGSRSRGLCWQEGPRGVCGPGTGGVRVTGSGSRSRHALVPFLQMKVANRDVHGAAVQKPADFPAACSVPSDVIGIQACFHLFHWLKNLKTRKKKLNFFLRHLFGTGCSFSRLLCPVAPFHVGESLWEKMNRRVVRYGARWARQGALLLLHLGVGKFRAFPPPRCAWGAGAPGQVAGAGGRRALQRCLPTPRSALRRCPWIFSPSEGIQRDGAAGQRARA